MNRTTSTPRDNWLALVEEQGLGFHQRVQQGDAGRPYWDESVHYTFTLAEVEDLEAVVEELHGMCLTAVDHVVKKRRFADYGIPGWLADPITASWKRKDPHVYGRFDLCYDGAGHAKLLEYNADTPTSLVESAVVQWFWKQDTHPGADQWNSLHERLIGRWAKLGHRSVTFAYTGDEESGEDLCNTAYMAETCVQAGANVQVMQMEDIGWETGLRRFVDAGERPIGALFKLYPWEWAVADSFGPSAVEAQARTPWVEPLWKMLLSNKALLAILWELYPGHPNLLPAYLDGPRELTSYAAKPLLGREGASMRLVQPGQVLETAGVYGSEGYVFQEFWPLPDFDGWRPVLGAWVVGDEAAGLGVRETRGLITDNTSSFVPHLIEG